VAVKVLQAHQFQVAAGAGAAGLVLGTRVPVLLTSRSDSMEARVNSCAVAALHAHAMGR